MWKMDAVVSLLLVTGALLFLGPALGSQTVADDDDDDDLPLSRRKRESTPRCRSNSHVCRTLVQYKDGISEEFTVDEGLNCDWPNCSSSWSEHDRYSLTWQHFKRQDWTVQYKMCGPIMPEQICKPGEKVAALLQTEVHAWQIHMRQARCRCTEGVFYLNGWERKGNLWIYEYGCEKPVCSSENSPCAKIYVNKGAGETRKHVFSCLCPEAFMCPTDMDDISESMSTESDDYGDYQESGSWTPNKMQLFLRVLETEDQEEVDASPG